jgi:putative ABC transport system permease protein
MNTGDMGHFGIDTTRFRNHAVPSVAIDDEALLWSMMKKAGDTLAYTSTDGREMKVVIATSYPTGVLHGHAIMPMEQFRSIWPGETGSKVILVRTGDESHVTKDDGSESMAVATLLSSALGDYGMTVTSTADRLRRFFEVTDAYLSIFMSLGGIGLLLGLASLFIVIRKNMAARREETRLYKTLGFSTASIVGMFRREQSIVPLYAILTGTTGSLISISANARGVPPSIWLFALALLLLLIFTTMVIIQISINKKTIQK